MLKKKKNKEELLQNRYQIFLQILRKFKQNN